MEELARKQKAIFTRINKIKINFGKDSAERKTKEYAEARLQLLNNAWLEAVENNHKLEEIKNENKQHPYFENKSFETLEEAVEELRENLERTLIDAIQRSKNSEVIKEQYMILNKQTELLKTLNRAIEKINEKIDLETSLPFITQNTKTLEEYWARILQNHMDLVALGTVKDNYFDSNLFSNAEESFQRTMIKLQEKYFILQPPSQQQTVPPSSTTVSNTLESPSPQPAPRDLAVKLPSIEIPKFNGDYLQWKSFRDLFIELIHNNMAIGKTQKLFYLKCNLTGEPLELIKHLHITSDNYDAAWGILEKRFNNLRTLISAQIRLLWNQQSIHKESAQAIKKLHDISNECLCAIKNLGVSTENWDPLLIHLLTQKLDKETHRLYEQSLKSPRDLETVKHFFEFLETRFQTLEFLENKTNIERQVKAFNSTLKAACPVCQQPHRIYSCNKFASMNHQQKTESIRKHKLCENCLISGHFVANCRSWSTCKLCNKKHHTLLHKHIEGYNKNQSKPAHFSNNNQAKQYITKKEQPTAAKLSESSVKANIATHYVNNQNIVLLATAIVKAQGSDGRFKELRVLIDQGSQATFISEHATQRLRLKKQKSNINVSGIGEATAGKIKACVQVTLKPRFQSEFTLITNALVLSKLTGRLPSERISSVGWEHLTNLTLADPTYDTSGRIDMIIGADNFTELILSKVVKKAGCPVAQETEFGYILSGGIRTNNHDLTQVQCLIAETDINTELCKFWESEELSPLRSHTTEEQDCENHFKTTHKRGPDGRYIVRIPFRINPTPDDLRGSRELAIARLFQMEKRFKGNRQLESMYKDFIQEYLQLGHMVQVPSGDETDLKYYLPHHAVFKHDSTTTKLRVVFDASVKRTSQKSLNDLMMVGPNIQQNLTVILLRWQKYKFVFTADIEKMYRQIKIDVRDQDVQRILWRNTPNEEIKEYKLTTVTYGTAAAPYLAIRTLRQLASDESSLYPLAAERIMKDTYVDDVVSGANSFEEAKETCLQLINMLRGGGFNLRKWSSNDTNILNSIPNELRESADNIKFDEGESVKALGIHWVPKHDTFRFKINIQPEPIIVTKRTILSEAARIFDPIGLLSPVTIKIKLLFQQIWLAELGWDDAVPENILEIWTRIKDELPNLEKIEIARWFGFEGDSSKCQIHGFCDASERAYCAAVYARVISNEGQLFTKLLAAKTKVAPLKSKPTLPRMELNGAVLLARLMESVERGLEIKNVQRFAWSDSQIVLSWISGDPHKWEPYVANRVIEIQSLLSASHWSYVSSENNPADLATRGIFPNALRLNNMWWKGPGWLQQAELSVTTHFTNVEVKPALETILQKFSSLKLAQRNLAYWQRYMQNIKRSLNKLPICTDALTAQELKAAMSTLIRFTQQNHFKDEIMRLTKGQEVLQKSRLFTLNPFLDNDNIIRIGGRLEEANMSFSTKHPIVLPYQSELTTLVIRASHFSTLHGGGAKTIEHIRQKYWILNGLKAVKGIIHRCVVCFRVNAKPAVQQMGNLPKARTEIARTFAKTGVDYAGPFNLKSSNGRGTKTYKGYIALFICLLTKAIHLEVVSSLTSQAFLAAFRRFVSRRGPVSQMYSDNGTNFVGASKILTKLLENPEYQREISGELAMHGVDWHFIPPSSPHFGGLWEAGIKATKHHMMKIIGEKNLTYEEMATLMTMIEACLNSRPLCPITNDIDNLEVLTPGHFLIGSPLLAAPQENLMEAQPNLLTRWQILDQMHQDFWTRWSTEYLSRLQHRPKWASRQPNIEIGNIVLIRDKGLPPTKWSLGRVINTHPGSDGLVRVVTLKTKNGTMNRNITCVSLLPIMDNDPELTRTLEELKKQSPITEQAEQSAALRSTSKRKHNPNHERTSKRPKIKKPSAHHSLTSNDERTTYKGARKPVKAFNISSTTMITILVGIFLVLASAEDNFKPYTTTQLTAEKGIFFEAIADANTYNTEWKLIVHFDFANYWKHFDMIKNSIAQLTVMCHNFQKEIEIKTYCMPMIAQLNHQFIEMENANQLLYYNNGDLQARRKRSPLFGFVGTVSHSLFGILDEEFAEEYEKQIDGIKTNEIHMKELLTKQMSVADSTLNLINREHNDIQQQFVAIKKYITALQEEANKSHQVHGVTEKFNSAALLISLDINSIRHIQQALISALGDTHHGRISTLLLTPAQLKAQILMMQQHLPQNLRIPDLRDSNALMALYNLMQVKFHISRAKALFEIRIPLLDPELYKIYNLIAIPTTHENKWVYVQPSSKYLIVNMQKDRYAPMETTDISLCKTWTNNRLICNLKAPLYNSRSNVSKCEMKLLAREGKTSAFCTIRISERKPTWIKMNAANSWIYLLDKETECEVLCGSLVEQVTLNHKGIFQLHPGCMLKHSSMMLIADNNLTGNLNTSFLLETDIPLIIFNSSSKARNTTNITLDELPQIAKEPTSIDIENLHKMIEKQREELSTLSSPNIHHLHHYTSIYVLAALLLIATFIYYFRRNKRIRLQANNIDQNDEPVEPIPKPRSRTHAFDY